jgi:phage shock protein PspC (stress-responsive transcriptional regulator)
MDTEGTDTSPTGTPGPTGIPGPPSTPGTPGSGGTSGTTAPCGETDTRTEAHSDPGSWFTTAAAGTDAGPANAPPVRPPARSGQRLHRVGPGRMLGGVALGLADYFDIDPTLVRIGFVALAFLGGLAVPLYLAGWLLIPDEDTDLSLAEELVARERSRAW